MPTKRKIGKDIQRIERRKCACGECDDFMTSEQLVAIAAVFSFQKG